MGTGAITSYIDVAQITLYLFWIFFAGLIYYLHRENKREGYPLESDRSSARVTVQGWPRVPAPKTYRLRDGRTVSVPSPQRSSPELAAAPSGRWLGAPLLPTGNPMAGGVGPGSWANRADIVDETVDGAPKIVPLRSQSEYSLDADDADPRGMTVLGADGRPGGTVRDLWVDRSETVFRYLEVEVAPNHAVLLPLNFTSDIGRRAITVNAILGSQFAGVPRTRHFDRVTLLEEEKIMAYYGAGTLYAQPSRQEPLL